MVKKITNGLGMAFLVALATLFSVLIIKGMSPKSLRGYVVMSGSMAPKIQVGSVVLTKPELLYFPGQVITFRSDPEGTSLVTHRIIEIRETKNYLEYLTKGDANEEGDIQPVKNEQIVGKVFLTVPYLGYLANFAKTQTGFILLIIVPSMIIIGGELKFLFGESRRFILKKRKKSLATSVTNKSFCVRRTSLFVVPFFALFLFSIPTSGAVFSQKKTIVDNTMQSSAFSPVPELNLVPESTDSAEIATILNP